MKYSGQLVVLAAEFAVEWPVLVAMFSLFQGQERPSSFLSPNNFVPTLIALFLIDFVEVVRHGIVFCRCPLFVSTLDAQQSRVWAVSTWSRTKIPLHGEGATSVD